MRVIFLKNVCVVFIITLMSAVCSRAQEGDHFIKAATLEKEGRINEAIVEYEKFIKENQRIAGVYNSIGHLYQYELKNYDKAKEIYLKGLREFPHDYAINLNLMYLYFGIGDNEKGVKQYEVLSTINPGNSRYSYPRETLDAIFNDMNKKEVLSFCEKYIFMNPTDMILRERLVYIYKEQKDFKKMKNQLETMLEYGEETGNVNFELGFSYYHLGHPKKALEYFKKAKNLGAHVPQNVFDRIERESKSPERE